MRIGLIDVDNHNFPSLPLMKLSAWHKAQGDQVEWYYPLTSGHMDRVYLSKVFSFSPDYWYHIDADEVIKGGTGYYYPDGGPELPAEIEHIYPDYSLYEDGKAYGFLSRGCPRGCEFCIVKDKEGKRSVKVADLEEFWHGQKEIVLLDPNMYACKEWADLSEQLIASESYIEFNQGVDIRVMTEEKVDSIRRMKIRRVHFAWDRYEDGGVIVPRLKEFKAITGWPKEKMMVYVLCNFDTTMEQDLERVYTLRDLGYDPYVMIYEKEKTRSTDDVRRLQQWVNNKWRFAACKRFEDFKR